MFQKRLSRHGSLAEATRSHLETGSEFRYHLASFLDGFYIDESVEGRRARLLDEPPFSGDSKFDALIGAIGEHLHRRWRIGPSPDWVEEPRRFLHEPWFVGSERMKPIYLVESPSAYRRRFIFTEAEPLRRARMPKDATWWFAEELRTGMTPLPDEIDVTRVFDEDQDVGEWLDYKTPSLEAAPIAAMR